MGPITYVQRFLRRRRRKKALTTNKNKSMLREFVYLDETSVYSLIASRLGPITTEFKDIDTWLLEGDMQSSLSTNVGLARGQLNSRIMANQSESSQVLRRSIVQTTFKEFYESEMDSLVMRPLDEAPELFLLSRMQDHDKKMAYLEREGLLIDPRKLIRGQLLEVEVSLEADPIFRMSTVVSSLVDMVKDDSEVFSVEKSEIATMTSVNRVLEKLLTGLVPLRGRAVDYSIVTIKDRDWIINNSVLNVVEEGFFINCRPLYLVGVAERALFWKDIRRVLFANSRFRVLCRVSNDGLKNSWTPVKLIEVLASVAPSLATELEVAEAMVQGTVSRADQVDSNLDSVERTRSALVTYAQLLAEHYALSLGTRDLDWIKDIADEKSSVAKTIEERRQAFEVIANYLLDRFSLEREAEVVTDYRSVALSRAGLHISGELIDSDELNKDFLTKDKDDELYLDSEFIAIYW